VKGSNYDVLLLRPRDIADMVDMSKAIDLVEQLPPLDPYIAEDATDLVAIEIKDMPLPLRPTQNLASFRLVTAPKHRPFFGVRAHPRLRPRYRENLELRPVH
jgi:hypothetical protein